MRGLRGKAAGAAALLALVAFSATHVQGGAERIESGAHATEHAERISLATPTVPPAPDGECAEAPSIPQPPDGELDTFVLPTSALTASGSWYIPDVQARFPDVDWSTLDRLYLPAGEYGYLRIGNLPERSLDEPLVITNHGGQVILTGEQRYAIVAFGRHHNGRFEGGGSGWILTGHHSEEAATGHPDFPGHAIDCVTRPGGYGIWLKNEVDSGFGVQQGARATDFEISFLEASHSNFAGIQLKTDNQPDATMRNVKLHDLYIHDTVDGEGFYIGSTQNAELQHTFENLEVFNNRVVRTGAESFQAGHLGSGTRVHHNAFIDAAMSWRHPFQPFQDGNTQLAYRYGDVSFDHNIVVGGRSFTLFASTMNIAGDPHAADDTFELSNNVFSGARYGGMYVRNVTITPHSSVLFANNVFRGVTANGYEEMWPDSAVNNGWVRGPQEDKTPVQFVGNTFDLGGLTHAVWRVGANNDGNGTHGVLSGSGNVIASTPEPTFTNLGEPSGFDHVEFDRWAERHVTGSGGNPSGTDVVYDAGELVRHGGTTYRCVDGCAAGNPPDEHPELWHVVADFSDDVTASSSGPYAGLGPAR